MASISRLCSSELALAKGTSASPSCVTPPPPPLLLLLLLLLLHNLMNARRVLLECECGDGG